MDGSKNGIAAQATDQFRNLQYESCLATMKKLTSLMPSDSRVLGNKALLEFICGTNVGKPDAFLLELEKAASLGSSSAVSDNTGDHNSLQPALPTSSPSLVSLHYNYALTLFYQKKYERSDHILSTILGISSTDATPTSLRFPLQSGRVLAQKCLLLWLDVCFYLSRSQRVYSFAYHFLYKFDQDGSPSEGVLEIISEIACPLRVYLLRACLQIGKIDSAKEELGRLDGLQKSDDIEKWKLSESIEYARAQIAYIEGNREKAVESLSALSRKVGESENPLVANNISLVFFASDRRGLALNRMQNALAKAHRSVTATATGGAIESRHCYDVLLHNSAVQMLLNPRWHAYTTTAFKSLLALTKMFPTNPRLWLRMAECCIKLHRPSNLVDWEVESQNTILRGAVGDGVAHKFILGGENEPKKPGNSDSPRAKEPKPSLEFARVCLRNAAFLLPQPPRDLLRSSVGTDKPDLQKVLEDLMKWASGQSVAVPPSACPLSGHALVQVISSVILASAYTSLCLHDLVEAIYYASQLICNASSLASLASGETFVAPDNFPWIGLLAPPAHRYLAKMYMAEAQMFMDRFDSTIESLLKTDSVSLPTLAIHALGQFDRLKAVTACLTPAYLVPQTHPSCYFSVGGPHSSEDDTNTCHGLHCETFPNSTQQSCALLCFNVAVALSTIGRFAEAKLLLQQAVPHLLINPLDPDTPPRTLDGILTCQGAGNRSPYNLPKQFHRLWLYLELKQAYQSGDATSLSAVNHLRYHIGAEAYEEGEPGNETIELSRRTGPSFDLGGGGRADEVEGEAGRPFSPPPIQSTGPPPLLANVENAAPSWSESDWPPLTERR